MPIQESHSKFPGKVSSLPEGFDLETQKPYFLKNERERTEKRENRESLAYSLPFGNKIIKFSVCIGSCRTRVLVNKHESKYKSANRPATLSLPVYPSVYISEADQSYDIDQSCKLKSIKQNDD